MFTLFLLIFIDLQNVGVISAAPCSWIQFNSEDGGNTFLRNVRFNLQCWHQKDKSEHTPQQQQQQKKGLIHKKKAWLPNFEGILNWKYRNVHGDNQSCGLMTPILLPCRSQWPRSLRRRSTAARLLRSWIRIPPRAWMFVVIVVYYQVEVSATSWSFVQRSPTDCGASLCVIKKPRTQGGCSPLEGCKIQTHNGL